jgi:hypothetical protein
LNGVLFWTELQSSVVLPVGVSTFQTSNGQPSGVYFPRELTRKDVERCLVSAATALGFKVQDLLKGEASATPPPTSTSTTATGDGAVEEKKLPMLNVKQRFHCGHALTVSDNLVAGDVLVSVDHGVMYGCGQCGQQFLTSPQHCL